MLDSKKLREALAGAKAGGEDWLTRYATLVEMSREKALGEVAAALALPVGAAADVDELMQTPEGISFDALLAQRCYLARSDKHGTLALIDDPLGEAPRAWLASQGLALDALWLVDPRVLDGLLERAARAFNSVAAVAGQAGNAQTEAVERVELSLSALAQESSPAVKLVSSTLLDALRDEASDIHIETVPDGLSVKFRLDGVLRPVARLPNPRLAEQVISRIKVLAELDISERRIPQDGRFRVAYASRDIDVRVSIMPSIHGEDAVLRILDKQALIDQFQMLTLDMLGFDARTLEALRRLASEPYGMLLVTGPTGSGKTTTLYAALSEINTGEDKIITIEDPVEYQLPGVLQIPVNEKKGLSFAVGLRSILRHDPDKILVGEIRDPETAQIAVQSALTGHLVFTSVHANNTFDVLGRFLHMGVDPYNFVSSLTGVVAQRLIRQICPLCSERAYPDPETLALSGISDASGFEFRQGKGCAHCRGTGYKGRRAVAEVLRLSDDMRDMIASRAPIRALKELAQKEGMRSLRSSALDLVREGKTTLQEINRVTFSA